MTPEEHIVAWIESNHNASTILGAALEISKWKLEQ